MTPIYCRSPYIVSVAFGATQIASKVELFIWRKDQTEPTTPSYTLSAKAASTTQYTNTYNIAPYIKEYIKTTHFGVDDADYLWEDLNNWCYVRVKRYYSISSGTYTLIDNLRYTSVYGYTRYSANTNASAAPSQESSYGSSSIQPLWTMAGTVLMTQNQYGTSFFPLLINLGTVSVSWHIKYVNDRTGYVVNDWDITSIAGLSASTLVDIPYPHLGTNDEDRYSIKSYVNGVYFLTHGGLKNVSECKYKPVYISYVNRYGGIEFMTFFKNKEYNISVKGTDYDLMPAYINNTTYYNTEKGQTSVMNLNGSATVKVNTGWVEEDYRERIKDLMLSETIVMHDNSNSPSITGEVAVKLKTSSIKLQQSLVDKTMNYTLEFEVASDLINNIV